MYISRHEVGYTGKDRWVWRKRWFRKPLLVQQIEVLVQVTENFNACIEVDTVKEWRDTRVDDIGLWRKY